VNSEQSALFIYGRIPELKIEIGVEESNIFKKYLFTNN